MPDVKIFVVFGRYLVKSKLFQNTRLVHIIIIIMQILLQRIDKFPYGSSYFIIYQRAASLVLSFEQSNWLRRLGLEEFSKKTATLLFNNKSHWLINQTSVRLAVLSLSLNSLKFKWLFIDLKWERLEP